MVRAPRHLFRTGPARRQERPPLRERRERLRFGRNFRVDTMGRATSHVRVERDGVLVDELDHSPAFTGSQTCGSFQYDLGGERELPAPAGP